MPSPSTVSPFMVNFRIVFVISLPTTYSFKRCVLMRSSKEVKTYSTFHYDSPQGITVCNIICHFKT